MSGGDEGGAGKRASCAEEISAIGHVAFSLFTVGRSVNACCPEGCSEVDGGDVLHGLGDLNISSLAPALEWPVRPPRLGSWPAHSLAVWAEALGAPWQVEQASA